MSRVTCRQSARVSAILMDQRRRKRPGEVVEGPGEEEGDRSKVSDDHPDYLMSNDE